MTSTDQTIDLQREELEIRDLQNVIAALRKELEDQHLEAKARVRETLTTAEGEQRQLRKTAAALRDEMERMHYDADASACGRGVRRPTRSARGSQWASG